MDYATLRLDSAKYMTKAHKLFRSFGFQNIEPYVESGIQEEYHEYWVFIGK
jgi:hypothetical protein